MILLISNVQIQILVEFCVNWATIKEKKKIKKERIEWCNCDPATLSLGVVAGSRCGALLFKCPPSREQMAIPLIQLMGTTGLSTRHFKFTHRNFISNSLLSMVLMHLWKR